MTQSSKTLTPISFSGCLSDSQVSWFTSCRMRYSRNERWPRNALSMGSISLVLVSTSGKQSMDIHGRPGCSAVNQYISIRASILRMSFRLSLGYHGMSIGLECQGRKILVKRYTWIISGDVFAVDFRPWPSFKDEAF